MLNHFANYFYTPFYRMSYSFKVPPQSSSSFSSFTTRTPSLVEQPSFDAVFYREIPFVALRTILHKSKAEKPSAFLTVFPGKKLPKNLWQRPLKHIDVEEEEYSPLTLLKKKNTRRMILQEFFLYFLQMSWPDSEKPLYTKSQQLTPTLPYEMWQHLSGYS